MERPDHISPEEWAKHLARDAAIADARTTVLPGPLRDAFAGEPRRLHGFTLQPVTARMAAALQRIDSTLLRLMRIAQKNPGKSAQEIAAIAEDEIKPLPESGIETVFLFVTPGREVWELLNGGREKFRAKAMEVIGDTLHPVQLAELERACAEHFAQSFITMIEYAGPKTPGDGTVFTQPPTSQTGSAGGSQ